MITGTMHIIQNGRTARKARLSASVGTSFEELEGFETGSVASLMMRWRFLLGFGRGLGGGARGHD